MILKGSQRGSGQDLAAHLMRVDDNEHVSLHELRGFDSDDLRGAFKEAEAISRGTNCRQYLFSLSLSPPEGEVVPAEAFESAIDQVEKRLGLEDQPRAIVIHEKEGRRHAHAAWSRIDAQTMTARHLSYFKTRLTGLSRELYLEHGWRLPDGLRNSAERNPSNFTLAEWQQAKRQDIDPRWLKQTLQECWASSDSKRAFVSSLQENGFLLARGDRRGHVVLDHQGEVWSLSRVLDIKAKDVRARLGTGEDLPDVQAAQRMIGERMTPAIRRHVTEARKGFEDRASKLAEYKQEMTTLHRRARTALRDRQRTEWETETRERAARLPKGLRGLWHRLTGKYRTVKKRNETEAQATRDRFAYERQQLIEKQLQQRQVLRERERELRKQQADQLRELRRDIGRFLKLTKYAPDQAPSRQRTRGHGLSLKR
ncbi:relaxase/mobilization nuclease domain-containing protein [Oricola indica]|uniref:relaxase/mobilization nuclease domain-containing protein n=1 Tax=Oricola indica TaxID=2872591 RepID=UPI001CBF1699|nr:relaxase/mobilization nuclease domain-containing protein [Oricola indica]